MAYVPNVVGAGLPAPPGWPGPFEPVLNGRNLEAITAGRAAADSWQRVAARWDEEARAFDAAGEQQKNHAAAAAYAADGAFTPATTRRALATFPSPVLLLAGAYDLGAPPRVMGEFAELFPKADLVVQPGAGHFPWRDDPARFVTAVTRFLDGGR